MKYPRQKIHFTTPKGWCNDPNGLIQIDGTYHLFYQHFPDDTKWGPMHWGHAVSKDLLTWTHLPIALFPDQEEYCFSGSAVLDINNVSGLGKTGSTKDTSDSKPPLLLFYTAHNPSNGCQTQCLAYSTDYVHFEKFHGNPVIKNPLIGNVPAKKDFRDPKVVPNPNGKGWIMVLAAGEKIEFWKSEDLLHWEISGYFTPGQYAIGGICECPDLLDFGVIGNTKAGKDHSSCEQSKQVLTMSMIYWDAEGTEHHAMQYFTGHFDGSTFTNIIPSPEPLLLDYGNRNYAAVTFANTAPHSYIMMGWAENWEEARENKAEEWFGKMTMPRKIELTVLPKGNTTQYRLSQTPVFDFPLPTENENLWIARPKLKTGESFSRGGISITMEKDCIQINGRKFSLKGTATATEDTSHELTVIFDNGLFEIFAINNLFCYTGETAPN